MAAEQRDKELIQLQVKHQYLSHEHQTLRTAFYQVNVLAEGLTKQLDRIFIL
jgi:hypothetical protein